MNIIDEIKAELKVLSDKSHELNQQMWPLQDKLEKAIADQVVREPSFRNVQWVMHSATYLKVPYDFNALKADFADIMFKHPFASYHFGVDTSDEITLRFDDNDFSVRAQTPEAMRTFIKENELKVAVSNDVHNRIKNLEVELEALKVQRDSITTALS